MKLKSWGAIIVAMHLTTFLILGCGYFEHDKAENEITVTGNISIHKQENAKTVNLVYDEQNGIFSVIVENCQSIYYDSSNRVIFSESVINKYNSTYFQINIINQSGNVLSAIKTYIITKNTFLDKTKSIKTKWVF